MLEAQSTPLGTLMLLQAVLASAPGVKGPDAPFLAQVLVLDCLGDADACVRATAADGLEGGSALTPSSPSSFPPINELHIPHSLASSSSFDPFESRVQLI